MAKLPEIEEKRLIGNEPFHQSGHSSGVVVQNFWQWSASTLAANNLRGHLAEFLVATDLGMANGVRWEWDECDIWTPRDYRIEVKSAAYIQNWSQSKHSNIVFGIAPAKGWNYEEGQRKNEKERNSNVYVFCLLKTKNQELFDPTDLDQWVFYIVATSELEEKLGNQKTLSLSKLKSLDHVECSYGNIKNSICSTLGVEEL